ncbi:MAG: ribosomal L7Ae/L30e/S12e/Gadd45 family protein [Candidatus Lokiarchaeota archaeon]|nr:ribosomal L7Ae/L30e/S12e/Gadd45 family protein [Candidatus Lokiarchaeota archaeon]MCK4778670.1 ribosomal L7Ae/L30e/S12e/Gadd45 family protein [Candidatus Lokiarchaeota archaeon]TKJ18092.1 MAG: 50S ribosomal protein L7ae [Candidatus Lokiarchaeota archaeon Loki_b32]
MSYVKFKIPDKLKTQLKNALTTIAETRDSKIRKGMNEVTKSIERVLAKIVVMAEDVSPPEILFHIPLLCEEKGIPYGYLSTKKELGNVVRINVSSSAIAIENVGTGNESVLDDVVKKLEEIKK